MAAMRGGIAQRACHIPWGSPARPRASCKRLRLDGACLVKTRQSQIFQKALALVGLGTLLLCGCGPRMAKIAEPAVAQNSNSYLDLQAGGQLRVLLPILKSGGYVPATSSTSSDQDHTIILRAADLEGYELVHYAVKGKHNGRVELRLTSVELVKEGKVVERPQNVKLPFALPQKAAYIRLIYLVRSSRSDHDMAIVASRNKAFLENLTARVEEDPQQCEASREATCEWVPKGISVRPE